MLTVAITVDVEGTHGTRPFEQMILGRVATENEDWGVYRIGRICDDYDVTPTFFVDVYEYTFWGRDRMATLCADLADAGYDVQLHTHPAWRDDRDDFDEIRTLKARASYLNQSKDFMAKLTRQEQVDVLAHGLKLLGEWTGQLPIAHRSGGYSINGDTIAALQAVNIPVDSSMNQAHPNAQTTWSVNAIVEREGLLELPVTVVDYEMNLFGMDKVFRGYRRRMKTDLDACSLSELVAYIEQGLASGLRFMNVFMHSYSLVEFDHHYRRFRPGRGDANKLEGLLAYIARRDDVRVMSCAQIWERYRRHPEEFLGPDAVPVVRANGKIARLAARKLARPVLASFRGDPQPPEAGHDPAI